MASYIVERHGYVSAARLISDLVEDMTAHGFELKSGVPSTSAPYRVILEAGEDVDPNNPADEADLPNGVSAKQPWRICFDVIRDQVAFAYVATPTQLTDDGQIAYIFGAVDTTQDRYGNQVFDGADGQNPFTEYKYRPIDIVGACGDQIGHNETSVNYNQLTGLQGINFTVTFRHMDPTTGIIDWKDTVNTGSVTGLPAPAPTDLVFPAGGLDDDTVGFINRARHVNEDEDNPGYVASIGSQGHAYPMTYRLVISPRGVWIGVWEEAYSESTATFFNWILVQRPVDRVTGEVVTAGKAPVWCVNKAGEKIWQFVVRENDNFRPSKRRSATTDTEDSNYIINPENQVALSEDGKYIVTFPSRLNTARYRYSHELDMMGITSADVVSQYSDVPVTVYGEQTERLYRGMFSNKPNNTGMRILVLKDGGGITGYTNV